MTTTLPTAYLLDDEPLALKRLQRMLDATRRVAIAGMSTDPVEAEAYLRTHRVDLLFIDIEMPEMSGFELLHRLDPHPLVVFTTAYSQYALQAFEVHSIDYLLKPVDEASLDRALTKMERMLGGKETANLQNLAGVLAQMLKQPQAEPEPALPGRLPSRLGDKVEFVEVAKVTHFFAADKLTFAATPQKEYPIEYTIQQLEEKLDARRWIRIHRSTIVNLEAILELHTWFGGKVLLRLNDGKRTELAVARDRVKELKDRIGLP